MLYVLAGIFISLAFGWVVSKTEVRVMTRIARPTINLHRSHLPEPTTTSPRDSLVSIASARASWALRQFDASRDFG